MAAVVAASLLFYYAAMNVFVGSRIFRDLVSSDPGSLRVDYARAYSLLPGRIHVEGLRIRGRDTNVEWILSIDRCDFSVSFASLLRRRFRAGQVDADGLTLRLRRRRDRFTPEVAAALPPVPGFLDPPLSDVGPPEPPLTDANYHLWSIDLEAVHARHVRELWIDTIRYAGTLAVDGSWFFKPMRWLTVGPAAVDLAPLQASFGATDPWVTDVVGTLKTTFHPTDLRATPADGLPGRVSARADLAGVLALGPLLERLAPAMRATSEPARFDAHLALDHGVVEDGASIHAGPIAAHAHPGDYGLAGTVRAGLEVRSGRATASLDATGVDVRRGQQLLVRVPGVTAGAESDVLDAAKLVGSDAAASTREAFLDASRVELPSVAAVGEVVRLPAGLAVAAGSGTASVRIDLRPRQHTGVAAVSSRIDGLRASFTGQPIAGDARLNLRVGKDADGVFDLSRTSIEFRRPGAEPDDAWWGAAEITRGTMRGLEAPRIDARVVLSAKNAAPAIDLVAAHTPIPKALLSLPSTDGLQASADIIASPRLVEARDVDAHCEGIDGRFEYVLDGDQAGWAVWLAVGAMHAAASRLQGSTSLTLVDTSAWFLRRVADLRAAERGAP